MNRKAVTIFTLLTMTCLPLQAVSEPYSHYCPVTKVIDLPLPRSHGAHPDCDTEWWYFTGHLQGKQKIQTYGFELTFFRVAVNKARENKSAWNTSSLYFAHFALTDDRNKTFHFAEQLSRDSFSQAGSSLTTLDVWIKLWRAHLKENTIRLTAGDSQHSLTLDLLSKKPIALQGDNGFSKKGPEIGDASYYLSYTRLVGDGAITIDGITHQVKASAWMDHEFSSSKLTRNVLGWDWFAMQLNDGSELMVYQLRHSDGSKSIYSSGSIVDSKGNVTSLSSSEFEITPTAQWRSPHSTITYPAKWNISLTARNEHYIVIPTVADQELRTKASTGVTYWEGRSLVFDKTSKQQIGQAYVELVGYK